MGRAKPKIDLDCALSDLPAPMRWREYMMRLDAVIFAASQPVSRETLSALIGSDCNLDLIIADIRDELRSRPYELVDVAGGFQHRTRRAYAEVIRAFGTIAGAMPKGVSYGRFVHDNFDASTTWKDIEWLRSIFPGR
jgi:segregation and condensation protein B